MNDEPTGASRNLDEVLSKLKQGDWGRILPALSQKTRDEIRAAIQTLEDESSKEIT